MKERTKKETQESAISTERARERERGEKPERIAIWKKVELELME